MEGTPPTQAERPVDTSSPGGVRDSLTLADHDPPPGFEDAGYLVAGSRLIDLVLDIVDAQQRHRAIETGVGKCKLARVAGLHVDPVRDAFGHHVPHGSRGGVIGEVFRRPQVDPDDLATLHLLRRADQQQARARPHIKHGFVAAQLGKIQDMLARADLADEGIYDHQKPEEHRHRAEQRDEDAGVAPRAGCKNDDHTAERDDRPTPEREAEHDARRIEAIVRAHGSGSLRHFGYPPMPWRFVDGSV